MRTHDIFTWIDRQLASEGAPIGDWPAMRRARFCIAARRAFRRAYSISSPSPESEPWEVWEDPDGLGAGLRVDGVLFRIGADTLLAELRREKN